MSQTISDAYCEKMLGVQHSSDLFQENTVERQLRNTTTTSHRRRAASFSPSICHLRKRSVAATGLHPPTCDEPPAPGIRIFLCGAHSTGKTTLFQSILEDDSIALGKDGKETVRLLYGQTEVARPVIQRMGVARELFTDFRSHPRVFEFVQHEISREQSRVEAENDAKQRNTLFDRGIDPVVYSWAYLGEEARDRLLSEPFLQESIQRYRKSVVFVVAPKECCVIDDGFRMEPSLADLNMYTDFMKRLFQLLDIPFHLIEETDQQLRTKLVLDIIKPLLLGKHNAQPTSNGVK